MKKKKKSKLQKKKDDPRSRYWRNKADGVWREKICKRDGDQCAVCNSDKNPQCHHLVSRDVKSLRHEVMNGVLLCPLCHQFSRRRSAHKGGVPFAEWLRIHRPYQYQWILTHWGDKDDKYNYKQVYNELKAN